MTKHDHDLIVIGAGPGGYVAAIRAAQLGMNVGIVEKEKLLGGTCLRVGCIPSKALLESSHKFADIKHSVETHGIKVEGLSFDLKAMLARKDVIVKSLTGGVDGLLKKNKIKRYFGHGKILGPGKVAVMGAAIDADKTQLSAKYILIATGSVAGNLKGIELDGDLIGTSTEALSYAAVPEHLVVIGAGVIGLELGSVWSRLGAKVTLLEYQGVILGGIDDEMAGEALKIMKKQGLEFILNAKVTSAKVVNGRCVVAIEGKNSIECDRVLVAVGRRPNTENLGLESVGIVPNKRGQIEIDEHFRTSAEDFHAIGDVVPGPMLAHKAEEEGVACVEMLAGKAGHVDYNSIPWVVYTAPEIAGVGGTEEDLKSRGVACRVGRFPFAANGRAKTLGAAEGLVKIIADAATDRILGVHIIGTSAGDMIAEAAAAMAFGASSEDLARTCHAHPTLPEAIKEAALAVDGRAIHF